MLICDHGVPEDTIYCKGKTPDLQKKEGNRPISTKKEDYPILEHIRQGTKCDNLCGKGRNGAENQIWQGKAIKYHIWGKEKTLSKNYAKIRKR